MRIVDIRFLSCFLSVKQKTLYQWAELGQIPCLKLNGSLRFDMEAVQRWLEGCKKDSMSSYNPIAQTSRCPRKGGKN